MPNPDRQSKSPINRSEQNVQNWSFDEVYQVLAVALLGEYNNALYRLQVDADGNLKVTGGSGGGSAAYSDSGGTDRKGLVDADRHVQVDVLTAPTTTVTGTVTANKGTGFVDPQTDALTDAQLRAADVKITLDGETVPVTGTFWQATQPVSAASLPLPSGAATETTLSSLNGKVTAVNTGNVTIGSALPAGTNAIGKLAANSGVDIGDVDVTSSVATSFATGSNLDIDTTAEQLVASSVACKFGVTVKSATTNTGTVYIGASSSVTAGTTAATDGFPLEPGESVTVPVNNINLLYGIASAADQKVFLMAV